MPVGGGEATIELFRVGNASPETIAWWRRRYRTARPLTAMRIESELYCTGDGGCDAGRFRLCSQRDGRLWPHGISACPIEARLRRDSRDGTSRTAGDLTIAHWTKAAAMRLRRWSCCQRYVLDRIAVLMTEPKVATDGLAHDLRSLLDLPAFDIGARAAGDSEEARLAVVCAVREGDRLLAMLDTALRISRAEAAGGEAFVDTDVGDARRRCRKCTNRWRKIEGDHPGDVPGPVHLPIHRELLSQGIGEPDRQCAEIWWALDRRGRWRGRHRYRCRTMVRVLRPIVGEALRRFGRA